MSDTYSVYYPVAPDCDGETGHSACVQAGAAWDFLLDRAADCTCLCHDTEPADWLADSSSVPSSTS